MRNINYIAVIAFFILMIIGAYLIKQANFNGLYFICGGIAVLVLARFSKLLREY
jgi:hypothetical protein